MPSEPHPRPPDVVLSPPATGRQIAVFAVVVLGVLSALAVGLVWAWRSLPTPGWPHGRDPASFALPGRFEGAPGVADPKVVSQMAHPFSLVSRRQAQVLTYATATGDVFASATRPDKPVPDAGLAQIAAMFAAATDGEASGEPTRPPLPAGATMMVCVRYPASRSGCVIGAADALAMVVVVGERDAPTTATSLWQASYRPARS
ncbi:MAG: hypothetical protein U0Q15_11685 [Kineosporiaceae bacterium]